MYLHLRKCLGCQDLTALLGAQLPRHYPLWGHRAQRKERVVAAVLLVFLLSNRFVVFINLSRNIFFATDSLDRQPHSLLDASLAGHFTASLPDVVSQVVQCLLASPKGDTGILPHPFPTSTVPVFNLMSFSAAKFTFAYTQLRIHSLSLSPAPSTN